jgi:hypothetical protein
VRQDGWEGEGRGVRNGLDGFVQRLNRISAVEGARGQLHRSPFLQVDTSPLRTYKPETRIPANKTGFAIIDAAGVYWAIRKLELEDHEEDRRLGWLIERNVLLMPPS